jgi:hypothetical protein
MCDIFAQVNPENEFIYIFNMPGAIPHYSVIGIQLGLDGCRSYNNWQVTPAVLYMRESFFPVSHQNAFLPERIAILRICFSSHL